MSTFLGIDLGTSATKAVIISDDGSVLARSRVEHPHSRDACSGRTDPGSWITSIRGACEKLGEKRKEVNGIGFDVHCPVIVPLDSNGNAVGFGVNWDNPRLTYYFNKYSGLRSSDDIRRTGNHPAQSTCVAVAYHFLRENDVDAFNRMSTMGFAGTWLGQLLTGEVAVDRTQASYSGIFDTVASAGYWLSDAIEVLQIDEGVLPPVRSSCEVLGRTTPKAARELSLPEGVPVLVGSADTPAAAFALGNRPHVNPFMILGTTHVVNVCLERPDPRAKALQRLSVRDGEWLVNGTSNGGDALAVGSRLAGCGTASGCVDTMIQAAFDISDADVVGAPIFIPHVIPERGPLWLDVACSSLSHIDRRTSERQVAWSIVEGVLMTDRMVMKETLPEHVDRLLLTGAFGGTMNFPQMMSDVMGCEFELICENDLPAIGAAGMAGQSIANVRLPGFHGATVRPRIEKKDLMEARWDLYTSTWSRTTGRPFA